MKKLSSSWRTWAAYAAGGLAVLLGGLLLSLKILFPPEKIQEIALERLQTALDREVRISAASIGLGGIGLEGLEVSEQPDFSAGTALTIQELDVRLKLLPLLLDKDIQVTRLALSGWVLRYSPNHVQVKPTSAANDTTTQPAGWEIAYLVLDKGRMEYTDSKEKTSIVLTEIEGAASRVRIDGAFPLQLDFAYAFKKEEQAAKGTIKFKGRMDAANNDPAKISLDAEKLFIAYEKLSLTLSGSLHGANDSSAKLHFAIPALSHSALASLGDIPAGFHLPALEGDIDARYAKNFLSIKKLTVAGEGVSLNLAGKQTSIGWNISPSRIVWSSLDAQFHGTVLSPSPKRKTMEIDFNMDTREVALDALSKTVPQAVPEGFTLTGNAELHVRARGPLASPALSGNASFTDVGFIYSGQTLHTLKGDITFSPESIQAKLSGGMNKGTLHFEVDTLAYRSNRPTLNVKGHLSMLDLGKLPSSRSTGQTETKGTASSIKSGNNTALTTSGDITIGKILHPNFQASTTTIRWDLKDLTPALSQLGGSMNFKVGPGTLKDMTTLSDKPLVKMVLMPVIILQKVAHLVKVPLFPQFDNVTFEEITGKYGFTRGVMNVQESHLDSNAAYAHMTGSADLAKDQLDLRVSTKLGVKQIAGPIGFKVRGSLADPKVQLDASSVLKQPAVEEVFKQGKQLFQNIFKR